MQCNLCDPRVGEIEPAIGETADGDLLCRACLGLDYREQPRVVAEMTEEEYIDECIERFETGGDQ